jgi:hypothetical protein
LPLTGGFDKMRAMNPSQFISPGMSPTPVHASKTLQVAALYEELPAFVRTHEVLKSLALVIHPKMCVLGNLWSFDSLTRLDLRHARGRVASEADVILVASSAASPLPTHVKSWITATLRANDKGAPVLVALYEEVRARKTAIPALREDLLTIAAQWRIPLLCNGDFDARLENDFMQSLTGREKTTASVFQLNKLLSTPNTKRWGIND